MRGLRFLLVFLSVLAIESIASCASPAAVVEKSPLPQLAPSDVPYVFEGVMALGSGNPTATVSIDTELPPAPAKVTVYKVIKPTVDDSYASGLARRLGFNGNPFPLTGGQREVYSFTNDTQTLEIYLDGRLRMYSQARLSEIPQSLPSDQECIDIAREWLNSHQLYLDNVTRVEISGGLSVSTVTVEKGSGVTGENQRSSLGVKFITSVGGYEMYTPGAYVVVGENGKILEVSINTPRLEEFGIVNLKTPDAALGILKGYLTNPSFNPPEAKECIANWRSFDRLSLKRVSLQYTSSKGDYLQPIYVFEGEVYQKNNPNMERFVGRVDAVSR